MAHATSPDYAAVVRRHGVVLDEHQADLACQRVDGFEVADAGGGIAILQPLLEGAVAVAGERTAVVEGAVDDQQAVFFAGFCGDGAAGGAGTSLRSTST